MASPINSAFTDDDCVHMRAALCLAKRGLGNVAPNPSVGCVLFRPDLGTNGRVVGRGVTQPGGRPHAETEAIKQAGDLTLGATAYVTLEPCNHHGQTGPCSEALISAGIQKVIVAVTDPDPRVQGGGVARLKEAGLEVLTGLMEEEARMVNAGFLSVQERGRPWVTLKVATSSDGMIAVEKGVPIWITGADARARGHLIRAQNDAILTGVGTVVADDPQMTCRLAGLEDQSPRRFVMDPQARMSLEAVILKPLDGRATRVFTSRDAAERFRDTEAEVLPQPTVDGRFDVSDLLKVMANSSVTRLMVEGGQGVNDAFLSAGLIDEIAWFRSPTVIGTEGVAAFSANSPDTSTEFERRTTIDLDGDRLERYLRVA